MYNTRRELYVKHELRVITMFRCRLTDCNKCTTLVQRVDSEGICGCPWGREYMRIAGVSPPKVDQHLRGGVRIKKSDNKESEN